MIIFDITFNYDVLAAVGQDDMIKSVKRLLIFSLFVGFFSLVISLLEESSLLGILILSQLSSSP